MLLLGIGLVLMLMGSSSRWQYLAPGPLCKSHAQILRALPSQQRCATCHAAAESEPTSWVAHALGGPQIGPTQSERCMACHQSSIDPQRSTLPHNLSAVELTSLGKGSDKVNKMATSEIACSVCHQEHHGADHALAAMDDVRCQACHQQQFTSFAKDHPPLAIWPYDRRTPIAFNHASHAGRHFADKGEAFACATCHQSDASGNVQLTLPYDQTCAKCHDAPLQTTLAGGVPLFALPMIDVEALEAAGEKVGAWPDSLIGDFDGPLPAPMKLLLAHDPDWQAIVEVLGVDFEMGDVDPDDAAQLRAAAQVVRAIKRQWWRLQSSGTGSDMAGLSSELLSQAQVAWLPELPSEMPMGNGASGRRESPSTVDPLRVSRDDTTMSLVYRPVGHSDPLIRQLIETAVTVEDPALREVALAELAGPTSPGLCATCHTIESQRGPLLKEAAQPHGPLAINWVSTDRSKGPRPFTKFSHRPHLTQVELRDCTSCHAIEMGAASSHSTGTNPHAFVSDFQAMSHGQCASCHQPHGAADRCTTCHNYHVGALPLSSGLPPTPPNPPARDSKPKKLKDEFTRKVSYDCVPVLGPITSGAEPVALDPPSDDEVIRALEKVQPNKGNWPLDERHHHDVRIVKEKIADYCDRAYVYPLVGPAQLHHAHYKCTVYYDDLREVVYIDHNHLEMVGNVEGQGDVLRK